MDHFFNIHVTVRSDNKLKEATTEDDGQQSERFDTSTRSSYSYDHWSQSKSRLPDTAVAHHSYQFSNSTCCLPCIFPLSYSFSAAVKVFDRNEVAGGSRLK